MATQDKRFPSRMASCKCLIIRHSLHRRRRHRPDIWRASVRIIEAAVEKAYRGARKIEWKKCWPARRRLTRSTIGCPTKRWKPTASIWWASRALTTPIGGGIRSLNVALRQLLDLYVCLRPVRWFQGCPRL